MEETNAVAKDGDGWGNLTRGATHGQRESRHRGPTKYMVIKGDLDNYSWEAVRWVRDLQKSAKPFLCQLPAIWRMQLKHVYAV